VKKRYSFLVEELNMYEKLLKKEEKPFRSLKPQVPETGDLRRIELFPPIYVLLVDSFPFFEEKVFPCLVLTEEIELAYLGRITPLLLIHSLKIILAQLPIYVYLTEQFLYTYTTKIAKFRDFQRLLEYKEEPLPNSTQSKYISLVVKRLTPFDVRELLNSFENIDKKTFQVIELDTQKIEELYEEYKFSLAAAGKKVLKGKNWLGIVEKLVDKVRFFLYLPRNYVNSNIVIKIKDKVIYQGKLESDKVILENFPIFSEYTHLEEELVVQFSKF